LLASVHFVLLTALRCPQDILADLRELRALTSRMAKDFAARAGNASTALEARDCMVEGIKQLEGLYNTSVSARVWVWVWVWVWAWLWLCISCGRALLKRT
jgi:hypothetical protein